MDFLKEPPAPPAIREAMAKASQREEAGLPVVDFSSGNVGKIIVNEPLFSRFDIEVNEKAPRPLKLIGEALKTGLLKGFHEKLTGLSYSPTGGTDSVKLLVLEYFKEFHGIPLSDKDLNKVIVTAGGQQALAASLRAIKPGTTVYIPKWEYAPASQIIRDNGCQEARIPIREDLSMDLDYLKENIKENSAFYASVPNNPTGYTSSEDLSDVLDVMAENDGGMVWDAPYLFTILRLNSSKAFYDKAFQKDVIESFKVIVKKHYQRMCILSSVSKTCLMAGLRFGFAAAPEKWINLMNATIGRENLSSPTHSFLIGAEALKLFTGAPITHEFLCEIMANRLTMLIEENIPLILPGNGVFGALYAMVKTGGVDSAKFSNELIEKYGVVTVPGNPFYGESVDAVRISLVATPWSEDDKLWEDNVKALKKALA